MKNERANDRKALSVQGSSTRRTAMIQMAKFAGACALAPRITFGGIRPLLSSSEPPVVETSSGKLRGALMDGIHSFRGIPYGASTAGRNRFMAPRKPEPWSGVRDALDNGHICPQVVPPAGTGPLAWRNELREQPQGEDCLVLNVFTPGVNDGRKRPVMYWCHGGGYMYESGSLSRFDGSNLARYGDVVVVSVTHRLNIFGFLDLAGIGGAEYADSGNAAILDSLLALQWVHDNIDRFGGDPGNVMLFGQSAGGGTVNALLTMPSAKGLFHRAAVQSGANFRALPHNDAAKMTEIVLDKLGLKPNQVDQLQSVPVEQLLAAAFGREAGKPSPRFTPVVDGRILPEQPFDPMAPDVSADIPMIIGTTATETTYFIGTTDASAFSLNETDMKARLQKIFGDATDSVIAVYRKDRPDASPSDIFFAITTDKQMRQPALNEAQNKVALGKAPVYMYLMTWETPVEGGKWKSPHSVDLPFVWDNLAKSKDEVGTDGAKFQPLADKMSGAWMAFAHTGNPSTASLKWPAYSLQERPTMIFDNECRVVNDPGKEQRLAIAKT